MATAALLALAGVSAAYLLDQTGMEAFTLPVGWVALGSVALAAPLAWRRRWPSAVALLQAGTYICLGIWVGVEFYASQVALFLGFYSVGAWDTDRRRVRWVRLAIVIAMGAWLVGSTIHGFSAPETGERGVNAYLSVLAIQFGLNIAYFGGAWVFGNRAWDSALERAELERAHEEIGAQQHRLAENAVALDRVRIARELHDVVAHHVTAIGCRPPRRGGCFRPMRSGRSRRCAGSRAPRGTPSASWVRWSIPSAIPRRAPIRHPGSPSWTLSSSTPGRSACRSPCTGWANPGRWVPPLISPSIGSRRRP